MRQQSNLKKFGHTPKSTRQRELYKEMIRGLDRDATLKEDILFNNFNGTEEAREKGEDEQIEGKTETIKKKPYFSVMANIRKHGMPIVVTLVTAAVIGSGAYIFNSFIDYGKNIYYMRTRFDAIESDVDKLKDKYQVIDERSLDTGLLLKEVRMDLTSLSNRINK